MKKFTILTLFMILAVIFTTWTPADASSRTTTSQAGGVTLTITNNMPKATTIKLDGKTTDYSVYVNPGATVTKTIDAGTYKYSYAGCLGKMKKGNLKIKGTSAELKIVACPMANVTFYNLSTKSVSLKLTGWMNYNISLGPSQSKKYQIVAASYDAVLRCGSASASGKLKFRKGTYPVTIRC